MLSYDGVSEADCLISLHLMLNATLVSQSLLVQFHH